MPEPWTTLPSADLARLEEDLASLRRRLERRSAGLQIALRSEERLRRGLEAIATIVMTRIPAERMREYDGEIERLAREALGEGGGG